MGLKSDVLYLLERRNDILLLKDPPKAPLLKKIVFFTYWIIKYTLLALISALNYGSETETKPFMGIESDVLHIF